VAPALGDGVAPIGDAAVGTEHRAPPGWGRGYRRAGVWAGRCAVGDVPAWRGGLVDPSARRKNAAPVEEQRRMHTLIEAAAALAAGHTTAAALTDAALARIAAPEGEGARAFITVHAESAGRNPPADGGQR
jgi:hypothetical protein